MRSVDVVIVGGGPAGASAAAVLTKAGADVIVLDKKRFPRQKLCAGWITPDVVRDIKLDVGAYPYGFLSFRRLQWHIAGMRLPLPCVQHSIRRVEFDHWLLQRSGAAVVTHDVRRIHAHDGYYTVDDDLRCRYLIGAGGTGCPVRRALFEATPRPPALQTVTLELEFACDWRDPDCHLWFFERGLPGYSWYVPKASGWLNVGIGGMASRLKSRGDSIRRHWRFLTVKMRERFGILLPVDAPGYSYYVQGPAAPLRLGNAFIIGDSAGLATRDLCEGIGPAIRSGRAAARAVLGGSAYEHGEVQSSLGGGVVSRLMDWAFTRGESPAA